jgi:hypothetical protein
VRAWVGAARDGRLKHDEPLDELRKGFTSAAPDVTAVPVLEVDQRAL